MTKLHSLGKNERLKSRKQIDLLFDQGKKLMVSPFRLNYQLQAGTAELKAGFTVGSRNFPRAVERNRIKRLGREAYRLQKMPLQDLCRKNKQGAHLFFIYTGREIPDFVLVKKSIGLLIEKLCGLV